jgi:N-acyl-phosphatidylethanolamine-hydrolysing phospholipase D
MHLHRWAWVTVALAAMTACASPTGKGFRNRYVDTVTHSLPTVLRWQWDAWRKGLPHPPATPTPRGDPDLAVLHDYRQRYAQDAELAHPQLTWVGHATAMLQLGGLSVLTDPMFSERAFRSSLQGPGGPNRRGWR